MSIVFPDWYKGGFPDRELLVCDLAQTYLDLCAPTGYACTWLTKEALAKVDAGAPVARVYRSGPGADGRWDPAAVQLGVIARTRAMSWEVMEYLRQMLLSYEYGGPVTRPDGTITQIASVEEIVGPQQLPEFNPDDRLVPATFRVECRRPQDLPDYAAVREELSL